MRIVAGEFKGRRLQGPRGAAARPTADKAREALFSILGDISGVRVLDLFAGTGALALEALSRGAASAVLVERDRRMAAIARQNAETVLGTAGDRLEIVRGDVLRFLARARDARFDLVLIDPPYADAARLAPKIRETLPAILASGAVVAVESDARSPLELAGQTINARSQHRYGDTLLSVFDSP